MSQTVKNILYIGHNIQLAKAMLNLSPVSTQADYYIHHLSCVDNIKVVLAERKYSHLICELPLNKYLADQIAVNFPLLQTTYLTPPDTPKTTELSVVMEGLMSDEVKDTLDYLSIPIYFKNRKGEFLACNSYFSHLFGMTPAQVIGKTTAEVLHPHLLEEIEKIDQHVFAEQKVYLYECKIQDQAGKERDMVFRKESVVNGKIQVGMLFDVTEINEARALLEKERVMLRATADISTDFICFKDLQGRYLGCNKEFERIVRCCEQDLVGKKDEQLFELEQALLCQAQDQEVMLNNKTHVGEEYRVDKSGERHFVEIKKVPLQDKQGKVQGLIAVGRDITEHQLMQKRLRIADAAFDNAKENMLVTDEQGNIITVNKACCATSGYSENELLQLNVNVFSSHQHERSFYEQIEISLNENKSWQGEITYRIKNGNINFAWLEIYVVKHPEEASVSRIYTFVDLNQSKSVEEKIQFLAKHDPLTGLFNRIALFTRLEDAISRATHKEVTMAVVFIDINGFKAINEQYGHNAGDSLLKKIAGRLKSCVFDKDTVARFGDDEFVIIIDELANEQDVTTVAKKIAKQFNKAFTINDSEVNLSATIGISICPDDGDDVDMLIVNAEQAMLRGKDSYSHSADGDFLQGRLEKTMRSKQPCDCTAYHFYTRRLTDHSRQQVKLENELKQALQLEQFELYYQPQYDLNKQQPVAVEAVLRWNHPQRGILSPESFLSLAENNGLLVDIGLQMLRKAAMQAVIWQNSAINFGRIAINLSQAQLSKNAFIADLQTILLETKCSSQWLEFGIDETVFETVCPTIHENLLNLKRLGIALTVNNFAEERAVLQLLEQLGIEKLKIPKNHIGGSSSRLVNDGLQSALFVLARSLGIDVVGDSLVNMTEESYSNSKKFDAGGGWLESKAMKASEATFYLRCHKRK